MGRPWTNGGNCATITLYHYGKVCVPLRIDVMGVGFDNLTKSEFTAKAEKMLEEKERGYLVTPNA